MKNLAVGVLCPLVLVLTACGGGGSSGAKPKSSSSAAVSSAAAVSSVAPASSAAAVSSAAPASSAAAVSSVAPASSAAAVSSEAASSISSSSAAVSSSSDSSVSSSAASSSSVSSSATSSSSSVAAQTGVFVDSAVAGIRYETAPSGLSGYTSPTGQYQYVEGDTVEFSIGDLVLPAVQAKGVVTPVDIAMSADEANAERIKVNIAALLQSLDTDGNPDNGISIDYEAASTVAAAVNFNQSYADFAASSAVTTLVANSGSTTTTLVSESAAKEHLDGSLSKLLVGTWYISGTSGESSYNYVLFILDEQNYAALDHDSGDTRIERGTYSWNQATGVVTVNPTVGNPSELDVYPPMANGNTLVLDGNVLKLSDADETFELTRLVPTQESPLKGGWFIGDEVVFAFTDDLYVMGQYAGESAGGEPGLELGTYSYNPETKAITYSTQVDFNGQWGLSHPCGVLNHNDQHPEYEESNYLNCGPEGAAVLQTMEVTGDTLTFMSEADTINNDGEEDPVSMERVVDGVPDGDLHLKLEVTLEYLGYEQGEFFSLNNGNATMQCDLTGRPAIGEKEILMETWVIGGNANRPTWLASQSASFDSENNGINFEVRDAVRPVDGEGHEIFSEQFWEKAELTYNKGDTNVITGTYEEGYDLTWTLDGSVSTCKLIYSVVGKLRPVAEPIE